MSTPVPPKLTDPDNLAAGRFCSLILVAHGGEFFALDMRNVTPENEACLVGRFFLTPAHAKRLLGALAENIERYEREFGPIAMRGGEGLKAVSTN